MPHSKESPLNRVISDNATTDGIDDIFLALPESDVTDTTLKRQKRTVELTVSQAAQSLGISERTLWRRIEKGELTSRRKGNKRFVRIPLSELPKVSDNECQTFPSDIGTVVDFKEIVAHLNAANFRIGYLQSQLENRDEQLKLLPDLQSRAHEVDQLRAQITILQSELARNSHRSWWQRFCSWAMGKD